MIENSKCKGLIYRGKINNFINSKGEFVLSSRLVPAKRLSCGGCEFCSPISDQIMEMYRDECIEWPSDIEHDKIYSLDFNGFDDEWWLEFKEVVS